MLTYSRLREIEKKEMECLEMVKVNEAFYSDLKAFLESKKSHTMKSQSLIDLREFENIKKVAKRIIAKRKEKLFMLSLFLEKEIEGATKEEQILLKQIRKILKQSFADIDSFFDEPNKEEPKTKVKIIKAIEAYKGFDNSIYGPFKEGEEIFLPEEEARWLLKSRMAEHLC